MNRHVRTAALAAPAVAAGPVAAAGGHAATERAVRARSPTASRA